MVVVRVAAAKFIASAHLINGLIPALFVTLQSLLLLLRVLCTLHANNDRAPSDRFTTNPPYILYYIISTSTTAFRPRWRPFHFPHDRFLAAVCPHSSRLQVGRAISVYWDLGSPVRLSVILFFHFQFFFLS